MYRRVFHEMVVLCGLQIKEGIGSGLLCSDGLGIYISAQRLYDLEETESQDS